MKRSSRRRSRRAASIESLETRRLLAFIVDTTLDESVVNDTTSLREAIQLASANLGDDTIIFEPTVFDGTPKTITLTSPLSYTSGSGQLFINGPGQSALEINGDESYRVLNVGPAATLTLRDLTIADGHSTVEGAGIRNEGDLLLRDVTFRSNVVVGVTGTPGDAVTPAGDGGTVRGGAIFNALGATLDIDDSLFQTNFAVGGTGGSALAGNGFGGSGYGGAIFTYGELTISDTAFLGNQALGGTGGAVTGNHGRPGGAGFAGAVFVDAVGSMEMTDSNAINNNSFGGTGGAGGAANIAGDGGNGWGGAFYSRSPNCTIIGGAISENEAKAGSGGSAGILSNIGEGGFGLGGAVVNEGTFSISSATMNNNDATGGASGDDGGVGHGGAIHNAGGHFFIDTVELTFNAATGGGGTDSGGSAFGGAISLQSGAITVDDSLIDNNDAIGGHSEDDAGNDATGGGIYTFLGTELEMTRTTVSSNAAAGSTGSTGSPGFTGGSALGGGLFLNGNASITESTIAINHATGGVGGVGSGTVGGRGGNAIGGGMLVLSTLTLENSTVYGNTAFGGTGGTNATLGGPGGDAFAGGIWIDDGGVVNATNVTIASNIASGGIGGIGAANGANGASSGGGAQKAGGDLPTFVNTIIADNIADDGEDLWGPFVLINSLVTTPTAGDYTLESGSFDNKLNTPANLGLLDDNGGPTQTALPDDDSEAIDSGNTALAIANLGAGGFDQRGPGFPRFIGTVDIGAVEVSNTIRINFQPQGAPVPGGFHPDTGAVYSLHPGNLVYGWNQNATTFTRDRNILSDQAKDTLIHTQLYGNRSWQIELENGAYEVHVVAGDAQYFNSVYKINVEGVLTVNGTPTSGNRFIEGTQTVVVNDGQLTITNAAGAVNNKIAYIEITPTDVSTVKINFQTSGSSTPAGYLADSGQTFANRGNGQSYGWNLSASSFARDRNSGLSPDQRYDTLIHTQLYGTRFWELAVPNGTYQVHLVAGDPSFFNSVYKFNLEGILALSGTPSSGNRWIEATTSVTVSDGRLTLTNAPGSNNNKIAFIEVTPL